MMHTLDLVSRRFSEQAARFFRGKDFLHTVMNDIFHGAMAFSRHPLGGSFRSPQWCEAVLNEGRCLLPNGRYCNSSCMGAIGLETPCPPGYQPSLAWGFPITGCWCDTVAGRGTVCCDCTPIGNSPYSRSAADCGCVHFYT